MFQFKSSSRDLDIVIYSKNKRVTCIDEHLFPDEQQLVKIW